MRIDANDPEDLLHGALGEDVTPMWTISAGQVHDDEAVQDLEPQRDTVRKSHARFDGDVADKGGPTLPTVARQVRRSILGDGPWRYFVANAFQDERNQPRTRGVR